MVQNNNIPPNQKYKTDDSHPWNDSLGRENFGVFFCNFLKTTNTPTVIELSAGYGEGKTTFLERCEKYIKQEQIDVDVININIWENDFNDNPFLALLESLNEMFGLEQIVNKKREKINENINAIFDVAAKFFPIGVIPENIIKNIFLEKGEKKQKTSKDFIQEIKTHLEKKTKKTIVFIDELDRCRPDYAIRTLEVIKHIFNVENIVFVLATDDNRLQSSVNSVYGSQVASEDYLRKFIDFQLFLPEAEKKKERYGILNPSLRERKDIDYFNEELNIRNKLYYNCTLSELSECNHDAYRTSLSFMVSLRHMKPNLYYRIGNHEAVDIEDMFTKLKFISKIEDGFTSELIITKEDIKNFIKCICMNKDEQERFLKNIFGENNLYVVTGLKDLSLNGIRHFNIQNGVTANGCKIRKYAVFIYLYKTFSIKGKSIAQQIYSFLEY